MNEERRAEAALEFLAASEREFAAGDEAQGSEKLWGAPLRPRVSASS